MDDEDWARLTAALATMQDRDIWIVDATDLTIEQIRAIAETHKRRYPHLKLIGVDYMGLIKTEGRAPRSRCGAYLPQHEDYGHASAYPCVCS